MEMKKTFKQIPIEIENTISNYSNSIEKAFINNAYDLDITAKIKMFKKDGKTSITTHIEFFPEPKTKSEKYTVVVDDIQPPLPFSEKKNKYREILFRNFDGLRAILAKLNWIQSQWKREPLLFKDFSNASDI